MFRRAALLAVAVSLACPGAAAAMIVVDDDAFGGAGGLIRVDLFTGARSTLSANGSPPGGPSFVNAIGGVIAPNGDILVADSQAFPGAGGGVIRVNPVTGARSTVSSNASPAGGPDFIDPFGITLAANGDILVADQNAFGGGGGVIRVNPATGARTAVSANPGPGAGPAFDAPWGIKVAPDGGILVADAGAFAGGGGIIRVNPATGARTTVSENQDPPGAPAFFDPIQLTIAGDGSLLVTDSGAFGGGGGVIRVNPTTGARSTVSANGAPAGGPDFQAPIGIAIAPSGDILVGGLTGAGAGVPSVIRVSPFTGARSLVSANGSPPGGPSFVLPTDLLVDRVAPDTAITAGPGSETRDRTPTFSFASSEAGSRFACSIDGGPATLCAPGFTPRTLRAGSHRLDVSAIDIDGNIDLTPARRSFRVLATLSDLPAPVRGRSFNVEPVRGTVTVALPRGRSVSSGNVRAAQKGLTFIPLREARQLPVGSFLNTRRGRVRLQSATTRRARRQSGVFYGGLFQVLQSRRRSARALTELRLKGSSFRNCRVRGSSSPATAARLSRRVKRRLRANARGRFRTRGRYSAATVRGTIWSVTDRCDGTLTRVRRGRVVVRDFRRKRSRTLRAGRRYFARAPG